MKLYLVNFLMWWYYYIFGKSLVNTYKKYVNLLHKNRVIPMVLSYKKPLYGDNSLFGRIMGILIRTGWIIQGIIISTISILFDILITSILFILPFWPVFLFLLFFSDEK